MKDSLSSTELSAEEIEETGLCARTILRCRAILSESYQEWGRGDLRLIVLRGGFWREEGLSVVAGFGEAVTQAEGEGEGEVEVEVGGAGGSRRVLGLLRR